MSADAGVRGTDNSRPNPKDQGIVFFKESEVEPITVPVRKFIFKQGEVEPFIGNPPQSKRGPQTRSTPKDSGAVSHPINFEPVVFEGFVRKPVKTLVPRGTGNSRPTREASFEPEIIEGFVRKPVKTIDTRGIPGNSHPTLQDRGTSHNVLAQDKAKSFDQKDIRQAAQQLGPFPLTPEQRTAAQFLEMVYITAVEGKNVDNMVYWINSDENTDVYYARLRDNILVKTVQKIVTRSEVSIARKYYKDQLNIFMSKVGAAARAEAYEILKKQKKKVKWLFDAVKSQSNNLHSDAVKVSTDAKNMVFSPSLEETKEIISASRGSGKQMPIRLERVKYKRAVQKNGNQYLVDLMAHPNGVQIINAFAESADIGSKYATEVLNECENAIQKLQTNLETDKTLIWRFPPAVASGVASLGYSNLIPFSLAWAKAQKGRLDSALDIAGNAIFALGLVGGPLGEAVSQFLDFILASIQTAVSFLRDVEQDQAKEATAFADKIEKLSEGSQSLGTILQGAATILTALAVPGAVRKITGRVGKSSAKIVSSVEHVPNVRKPLNPQGISQVEKDVAKISDQAVETRGKGELTQQTPSNLARGINDPHVATINTKGESQSGKAANLKAQRATDKGLPTNGSRLAGPPPPKEPRFISDNVNLNRKTAQTGGIKEIWAHRYSDGSREFKITGELRPPLIRKGKFRAAPSFNENLLTGREIGLPDYENAHLWGPGFGDEAWDGIMYAPKEVNQVFQNRGIEQRLRDLQDLASKQGASVQLTATAKSHPLRTPPVGHEFLAEVNYNFSVKLPDGTTKPSGIVHITVPPPNSKEKILIEAEAGSAGVWSLL